MLMLSTVLGVRAGKKRVDDFVSLTKNVCFSIISETERAATEEFNNLVPLRIAIACQGTDLTAQN